MVERRFNLTTAWSIKIQTHRWLTLYQFVLPGLDVGHLPIIVLPGLPVAVVVALTVGILQRACFNLSSSMAFVSLATFSFTSFPDGPHSPLLVQLLSQVVLLPFFIEVWSTPMFSNFWCMVRAA